MCEIFFVFVQCVCTHILWVFFVYSIHKVCIYCTWIHKECAYKHIVRIYKEYLTRISQNMRICTIRIFFVYSYNVFVRTFFVYSLCIRIQHNPTSIIYVHCVIVSVQYRCQYRYFSCIRIQHKPIHIMYNLCVIIQREVGGWGRDPKKCTGRDWGMGSSTI